MDASFARSASTRARRARWAALSLGLAVAVTAAAASAQEGLRLPISEVDRPLVDPAGTLQMWGYFYGLRAYDAPGRAALFAGLTTGLEYAITNDLTIGGRIVGVDIAPRATIEYPAASIRWRLVRGPFQLGLIAGASFFAKRTAADGSLQSSAGTTLWVSIPMRIIVPHRMKVYFSPEIFTVIPFDHATLADTTRAGLELPLSMLFRIVNPLALGFSSGYGISRFDRALETSYVPLGFRGVITVPGRQGPVVDFGPSFSWPYLFTPGSSLQRVHSDVWQVALSVTGYVYL